MARRMGELEEGEDLMRFSLEHGDEFTRRDWLASLSLLTTRKRFSTSQPIFQKYSQRVLRDAELWEGKLHLLLHRYGVLGYAPAVWRLLPLLQARLPMMAPGQLAVSSWTLGRTLVNDEDTWAILGEAFRHRAEDFSLPNLSRVAWALAAIGNASPPTVVALKRAARGKLRGQDPASVSSHSTCVLFKAVAKLTPQDRRFLEWLLLFIAEGMAAKTVAYTAQGITSLWTALQDLPWRPDEAVLEALCEESRGLRLDHAFNQDMAAGLARALMKMDVRDARPEYAVVDFVIRRGLKLRGDTVLVFAEFMCVRGIEDVKAWKRIGVRSQQRAVDLRMADIDRLAKIFQKSGKGNARIYGMLQLFMRLREDQARFGVA